MALTDRLAYIVTADPRQAVAGFGQVGQAAAASAKKADAAMASLQTRIDRYEKQAFRTQKKDPLGADIARIKAAELGKELDRLKTPAAGAAGALAGVGLGGEVAAAGAALATAAVAKFSIDAAFAADKQATALRQTDAVFKESAGAVREFAADADQALGVSETAALNSANAFGNLFAKAGTAPADAAKLAQGVTSLASVLSAANPTAGDTETALVALQAAFRGEFDPLEKFKVKINATIVEQKALALGLASTTKGLTEQDKQLATVQLLYEQTNVEQRLFAENSETLAFRQQKTNAALADFQAQVGGALKDNVGDVADAVATLANAAEKLSSAPEGEFLKGLARLAVSGAGPLAAVFDLSKGFNLLFGSESKAADVQKDINSLNIATTATSIAAAGGTKELAEAQKRAAAAAKEVIDTSKAQLSAAEGLLDADDRVVAAKKAVADASDDEAEKAEKVADARRGEEDAADRVAEAEDRLAKARRDAPRDIALAGIAARDAARTEAEAIKDRDKALRRRGPNDPKTLEAQDRLAAATIGVAKAQDELNELQGKGGIPAGVQDAIEARDDAMRAATDAERRTRDALAINPYEAQRDTARELRDAENDRARAVAEVNDQLAGVSAKLLDGFNAATATRAQIEGLVAAMKEADALRATLSPDFGGFPTAGRTAGPRAQIAPDLGSLPKPPGAIAASATRIMAQYNGPITVQANDPGAMQRALEAEARRRRVTQP